MSNCTEVLNGPAGDATMLTLYQGNFTRVLKKLLEVKQCQVKGDMRNIHWILLDQNTSDGRG